MCYFRAGCQEAKNWWTEWARESNWRYSTVVAANSQEGAYNFGFFRRGRHELRRLLLKLPWENFLFKVQILECRNGLIMPCHNLSSGWRIGLRMIQLILLLSRYFTYCPLCLSPVVSRSNSIQWFQPFETRNGNFRKWKKLRKKTKTSHSWLIFRMM